MSSRPESDIPQPARRLPWSWYAVAFVSGAVAVLAPALMQTGASGAWRAIVESPSVYTFHGLMLAGFIIGLLAPLKWLDLPLVALAMIALFPTRAIALSLAGRRPIQWPREFMLYAAWLMPAMGGLALGLAMRNLQKTLRRKREEAERKRKRAG